MAASRSEMSDHTTTARLNWLWGRALNTCWLWYLLPIMYVGESVGFTNSFFLTTPSDISTIVSRNSNFLEHDPVNWMPRGSPATLRATTYWENWRAVPIQAMKTSSKYLFLQSEWLDLMTSGVLRSTVKNNHFTKMLAIDLESDPPVGIPFFEEYQDPL